MVSVCAKITHITTDRQMKVGRHLRRADGPYAVENIGADSQQGVEGQTRHGGIGSSVIVVGAVVVVVVVVVVIMDSGWYRWMVVERERLEVDVDFGTAERKFTSMRTSSGGLRFFVVSPRVVH